MDQKLNNQIATQIGEAQALAALEGLAKQLGGEGLAYWEQLSVDSTRTRGGSDDCVGG